MTYTYSADVVKVSTDNRSMDVVFTISKKEHDRLIRASHCTSRNEVHIFTVKGLRVIVRNTKGVIVLTVKEAT